MLSEPLKAVAETYPAVADISPKADAAPDVADVLEQINNARSDDDIPF
jgi:hypothetical protein